MKMIAALGEVTTVCSQNGMLHSLGGISATVCSEKRMSKQPPK